MLGYRWEDRGHRVVVDDEAAVVREVYERAAVGEPLADLGRSLGWARDRLLRVLRHPAYAGAHVTGRRTGSLATGRRRQPREAWRVSWGAHPAIVPRELWESVQAHLDGHRPGPPSREGRLALSGLLVCQDCGDQARSSWPKQRRAHGRGPRPDSVGSDCRGGRRDLRSPHSLIDFLSTLAFFSRLPSNASRIFLVSGQWGADETEEGER